MKCYKLILLTWIISFIFIPINVAASEQSHFQTSEISENELGQYINKFSVSVLDGEPEKLAIKCFDVSKTGQIAIGGQKGEDCYVYIYNSNFEFIYAYKFQCNGTYYIEWNNEYINIYYVRSDVAATYNCNAELISIKKIDNTIENNSYWYTLRDTERQIDDIKYIIKNDMGILNLFVGQSSYSQLVKIDGLENQTILYDINDSQIVKTICIMLFFIVFIISAICIIVFNIKKQNSVGTSNNTNRTGYNSIPYDNEY